MWPPSSSEISRVANRSVYCRQGVFTFHKTLGEAPYRGAKYWAAQLSSHVSHVLRQRGRDPHLHASGLLHLAETLRCEPLKCLSAMNEPMMPASHRMFFCCAEDRSPRQPHQVGAPRPVQPRRQVQQGAHHAEEAFRHPPHAAARPRDVRSGMKEWQQWQPCSMHKASACGHSISQVMDAYACVPGDWAMYIDRFKQAGKASSTVGCRGQLPVFVHVVS